MEEKVLKVIEFDVNCTPSQTFLENYCRAISFNEPQVLTYASFLLDLALIKAEFLQFKTSHLTVCALVVALNHEMKRSGLDYQEKLIELDEVMQMEQHNPASFLKCRSYFEKFSNFHGLDEAQEKRFTSLVLKYAGTGAVRFP